jgi:hypothetical protein
MFVYRRFPYFLLGFELYPDRLAVASCNCNVRTTGQLRLELSGRCYVLIGLRCLTSQHGRSSGERRSLVV